jgi:hypothetical protein
MSAQPLTSESVLEMIRETRESIRESGLKFDREMAESRVRFDREMAESSAKFDREMTESSAKFDREMAESRAKSEREMLELRQQMKQTDKKISKLGSRIGEIIEHMVGGRIIDKFQALGYEIDQYSRNKIYKNKKLGIEGEIDMFLEDGEIAILISVKTTLETADVRRHMKCLEQYRLIADMRGDKRRFVGAVAGAVVKGDAKEFAHENGMYVIVQSGEAVEILPTPEGFKAKEW